MAKEESVIDQIKAMEGWAIQAKQLADARKYDEAVKLLKEINTQGRKLEWRGGSRGLRQLPQMEETKQLQLKISQARSATQGSLSAAQHLSKLGKKAGKTPAAVAAIKSKGSGYLKDVGKNLPICIQVLKEANALVSSKFWMDPKVLLRPENKAILIMVLRREGFYKNVRPFYFNRLSLAGADLHEADLHEVELQGVNFQGGDLSRANLSEADLRGVNLREAKLYGANLFKAYLVEADLSGADLRWANLSETNLRGAKGITLEDARRQGVKYDSTTVWPDGSTH